MGGHLVTAHNQLQPARPSDARRQFLSTLAPLTACVAGQRDDFSMYSLAAGDRNSTGSSRCSEYSIGDIEAILQNDDMKKIAPDVLAGTPGQEQQDELAAFAQQEATRTERIKKRYSTESSSFQVSFQVISKLEQNSHKRQKSIIWATNQSKNIFDGILWNDFDFESNDRT